MSEMYVQRCLINRLCSRFFGHLLAIVTVRAAGAISYEQLGEVREACAWHAAA